MKGESNMKNVKKEAALVASGILDPYKLGL